MASIILAKLILPDFFKFNQSMEETFKNDNEFSRVPIGEVRFVFKHENSEGSDDFIIKDIGQKYERITVPPGIWFDLKEFLKKIA